MYKMKNSCIIGYTGFIGGYLARQIKSKNLYNTKNIVNISKKNYDIVYCCAPSSAMWIAKKNPIEDFLNISNLIKNFKNIKTKKFILISTIEVYKKKNFCDENSSDFSNDVYSYGYNRYLIEEAAKKIFKNLLIVRLPIVYGLGVKKNIIFDLKNNNNLDLLNLNDSLQFYPVEMLLKDLRLALKYGVSNINLCSEPIKVKNLLKFCLIAPIVDNPLNRSRKRTYNMRSVYSYIWKNNKYTYKKDFILKDIKKFIYNENRNFKFSLVKKR